MRPTRHLIVSIVVCAAVAAAILIFFMLCYPYHFYHREQFSLFLSSSDFIRQMFSQGVYDSRAWLPAVVGGFLTQFYYYVGCGPVIVVFVLYALGGFVAYGLRRLWVDWRVALGAGVAVMIWEAGRQCVGEYPLSSSLSLLFGVILANLYPVSKWPRVRALVAFAIVVLGLTSVGYGCVVAFAYIIAAEVARRRWRIAAMALVAMFLAPWHGFIGGCWLGWPDLTSESILRVDTKTWWNKKLSPADYPPRVRNTQIANCLYTLHLFREKADVAIDDIDLAQTQLFLPVAPSGNYLSITAAGQVWYAIGDMTLAEHATILGMIFSPNHSCARHVIRLAEINIIRGDEQAADKYLGMLSHTFRHAKFAHACRPENRGAAYLAWLADKRAYLSSRDTLRASDDYRRSLRNLLDANPSNGLARTYLLALDLQETSMADFAEDYLAYANGLMTRTYAEALMVVSTVAPPEVRARLAGIEMPSDVVRDFDRFNDLMQRRDASALKRSFAHSYWLYCQLHSKK